MGFPGVNGNGLGGQIPVTRSQAGVDSPPPAPAVTPAAGGNANAYLGPYPKAPVPTLSQPCPVCKVHEMKIARMENDAKAAGLMLDSTRDELSEMSMKLEAASGVTINARQSATIKKLQKTEEIVRNAHDHLAHENTYLRLLCAKNNLDVNIPPLLAVPSE